MIEQWRDIAKWDNHYQVSNFGRIKRKERLIHRRIYKAQVLPEIIIEPIVRYNGYTFIKVVINKKIYRDLIGNLVYEAFQPDEIYCPISIKMRNTFKLEREKKAEIIEAWVNNPNISLQTLADRFHLNTTRISSLISSIWLFKQETVGTERITLKSSMDDEIELRKTA